MVEGARARSPVLGLSLAFAVGIFLEPSLRWCAAAIVLCGFAALIAPRTPLASSIVITLFVWIGYAGLGGLSTSVPERPERLPGLYVREGAERPELPWLIEGWVTSSPVASPGQVRFELGAERARFARVGHALDSRVRVYVRGDFLSRCAGLRHGERVRLWGRLGLIRGATNEPFSSSARLRPGSELEMNVFVKSGLLVESGASGDAPIPATLLVRRSAATIRLALADRLARRLRAVRVDEEDIRVAAALLVGERARISEETESRYRRGGLLHVLALSGAHVAIWLGVLHSMVALAGTSLRARHLTMLGFVVTYALICGARASIVRASAMAFIVITSRALSLAPMSLNALALAGLGILVISPSDLFDVGFQLSFLATASILAFFAPLRACIDRTGFLASAFCLSAAAQLGIVPVLAYTFHEWVPFSILSAALALPSAALVMISAALCSVVPELGLWLASRGVVLGCAVLDAMGEWSSTVGLLGPVALARPGIGWMLVYGASLCLFRAALSSSCAWGWWRRGAVAVAPWLTVGWLSLPTSTDGRFVVHALDVGHGDAIVVGTPEDHWLLIDGGGARAGFDAGRSIVLPFLRRNGIRCLDAVLLSHPDRDHSGGLAAVVDGFPVRSFWSAESALAGDKSANLRRALRSREVPRVILQSGDRFEFGGVAIEILAADARVGASRLHRVDGENDRSVVLRIESAGRSVLFTGDAEGPLEGLLATELPRSLEADVLKVAHHGSATSSSPRFLSLVRPSIAIVSTRSGGARRLPSPETLGRIHQRGIAVLRTDRDGAISIVVELDGSIRLETTRQLAR